MWPDRPIPLLLSIRLCLFTNKSSASENEEGLSTAVSTSRGGSKRQYSLGMRSSRKMVVLHPVKAQTREVLSRSLCSTEFGSKAKASCVTDI